MQFFQALTVVFGLALLADALPSATRMTPASSLPELHSVEAQHVRTKRPVHIKSSVGTGSDIPDSASETTYQIENFILSRIELTSTTVNETQSDIISFLFFDQNSNTSTHCTQTFTPTPSPTDPTHLVVPTNFVLCDHPTNFPNSTLGTEFFQFHFTTFISTSSFSLTLAHEFNDPTHYAPPWSQVEYFSDVDISLICKEDDAAGLTQICGLQDVDGEGELSAVVNWVSN